MKVYMETGCLRQPPANQCIPLFYLSLSSIYPLVTGIVTGILRHFSHDGCGTIFKTFPFKSFDSGTWDMADGRWQKTAAGNLTAPYGYMETRLQGLSLDWFTYLERSSLVYESRRQVCLFTVAMISSCSFR